MQLFAFSEALIELASSVGVVKISLFKGLLLFQ